MELFAICKFTLFRRQKKMAQAFFGRFGGNGRMREGENGRMGEWENGRMGEWKNGGNGEW
jgi:hypothetical protein